MQLKNKVCKHDKPFHNCFGRKRTSFSNRSEYSIERISCLFSNGGILSVKTDNYLKSLQNSTTYINVHANKHNMCFVFSYISASFSLLRKNVERLCIILEETRKSCLSYLRIWYEILLNLLTPPVCEVRDLVWGIYFNLWYFLRWVNRELLLSHMINICINQPCIWLETMHCR